MTVTLPTSTPALKKKLREELTGAGLKPEATKVLPEWWEDAIVHPSGLHEIRAFVAKHFGMKIGPNGLLGPRSMPPACFKTRKDTSIADVAAARGAAAAVAGIIASATRAPSWTPSENFIDAAALRAQILADGRPWVGLEDLLAQCWHHGVPVIYLPSLPVTGSKMVGMVTFCGTRPVIIVTKAASHPAWILFVLAHEMGHLALGHLDNRDGASILDEDVAEDETHKQDLQENEANLYALRLLTGNGHNKKLAFLVKAENLAHNAMAYGKEKQIDPGHLILNAVRNTAIPNGGNPWPLANKALSYLPGTKDSVSLFRRFMKQYLDTDSLSDDSLTFLERLSIL